MSKARARSDVAAILANSRRLIGIGAAALTILAAAGGAVYWWRSSRVPRIDPNDAAQVAEGHSVYAAQCARCHGANLEGQPNWKERQANGRLPAAPHDASGHTWHHPDSDLFGITKHGLAPYAPAGYQSDMPAFDGTLSDDQIAAVLAYIKSTWPPDVRERQSRINAQAAQQ
ncbi:MAG: c-type cytochrome [Rhodospirillales bacterium]|nr:c-type cytochrome [Rhodospirillales bacterium]